MSCQAIGVATVLALRILAAVPAVACEPRDCRWNLRVFALSFAVTDDEIVGSSLRPDGVLERSSFTVDGGTGAGFVAEYRFGRRIGLEGGVLYSHLDSILTLRLDDRSGRDTDSASLLALVVGPNYHLMPDRRVDPYVGFFVGFVDPGDGLGDLFHDESEDSFQIFGEIHERNSLGDGFLVGVQLGVDIPLGERSWGLHLGIRYLEGAIGTADTDLALNPVGGELGLVYRF